MNARIILQMIRPRLSTTIAASALAGYLLYPHPGESSVVAAVLGTFLLASGCSILNQVQERKTDALMRRTCSRPIPSGRMSASAGGLLSFFLMIAGLVALAHGGNLLVPTLGLFGAALYNGIYTPLKKVSIFALLPGALCGAVPPVIGWTAAGGGMGDFRILLLAGLFFLWQIPHFWFFADRYRDDYRRAGLPCVFTEFSPAQASRILSIWTLSLGAAAVTLPIFGLVRQPTVLLLWIAVLAWFFFHAAWHRKRHDAGVGILFHRWNLVMAFITVSAVADRFLS
jgi:heme o synthase